MKISIKLFLLILVSVSISCIFDSSYKSLGSGFEIGWIDNPNTRNIVYNSQGIFDNYVLGYDKSGNYIIVYTQLNKIKSDDSLSDVTNIYIIDMKDYKADPNQMISKGVIGPFKLNEIDSLYQKYMKGKVRSKTYKQL